MSSERPATTTTAFYGKGFARDAYARAQNASTASTVASGSKTLLLVEYACYAAVVVMSNASLVSSALPADIEEREFVLVDIARGQVMLMACDYSLVVDVCVYNVDLACDC